MTNYKAWYDPQENKYYLKIDGEEKQEITKTQFDLWTNDKPVKEAQTTETLIKFLALPKESQEKILKDAIDIVEKVAKFLIEFINDYAAKNGLIR